MNIAMSIDKDAATYLLLLGFTTWLLIGLIAHLDVYRSGGKWTWNLITILPIRHGCAIQAGMVIMPVLVALSAYVAYGLVERGANIPTVIGGSLVFVSATYLISTTMWRIGRDSRERGDPGPARDRFVALIVVGRLLKVLMRAIR